MSDHRIGFLVWCPEQGFPTRLHDSFARAVAEAERLKRLHPGQRFIVMSPVLDASDVGPALAWSRGNHEGLAQAHREIMKAEAVADRLHDEIHELRKAKPLIERAVFWQSVVADCLCWFDGFAAAHANRESYDQPAIPDRHKVRALNSALQSLLPADDATDEIPF